MLESYVFNYIILFVLLEIYEIWAQRAETLLGMLARMYEHYEKSVWLFLVMQPTFIFAMGFMILCEYNIISVTLFSLKAGDILTKMFLIKKVFIEKELSSDLSQMIVAPINKAFIYMGLIIYPLMIVGALS